MILAHKLWKNGRKISSFSNSGDSKPRYRTKKTLDPVELHPSQVSTRAASKGWLADTNIIIVIIIINIIIIINERFLSTRQAKESYALV